MRLVIKLGTSTLTDGTPHISTARLVDLARQMAALREAGHDVILVSSGAMAAGREVLHYPTLPKEVPAKQMLAAIGQPRLMSLYQQLFGLYQVTVAQVLLTRADLANRRRYLNARNTLNALLSQRVVPIINENDTVATEEIRVGDNDNLSALVANLADADTLVLLTDQPGLFTADPRQDPSAQLITDIDTADIPPHLWEAAGGSVSGLGIGGMTTKLQAADLARRSGTHVMIAQGNAPDILLRIANHEKVGTHFHPVATAVESRKRYILAGGTAGGLKIDDGAGRALKRGGSLLPVGVSSVEGTFERGDTIRVTDLTGREIARGIANYSADDLSRIQRRQSDEIEALLGYNYGDEVIHRNDLVLL
jgi:glutamate 5-kinase